MLRFLGVTNEDAGIWSSSSLSVKKSFGLDGPGCACSEASIEASSSSEPVKKRFCGEPFSVSLSMFVLSEMVK